MKKSTLNKLLIACLTITVLIVGWILYLYNLIPHARYSDEHFGIHFQASGNDANKNGIDDFLDILQGAKEEAKRSPTYHSAYYAGGYPPPVEGVCTDVIWRSLKVAGYDLKTMVDEDIASCVECYPRVHGEPDPNIDFRRVPNLAVFFERHTMSLTTDLSNIEEWQAGDIVIFSDSHIGIISDIRNAKGVPFLIHNGGLPNMEEDCLWREDFLKGISGHYRFVVDEKIRNHQGMKE